MSYINCPGGLERCPLPTLLDEERFDDRLMEATADTGMGVVWAKCRACIHNPANEIESELGDLMTREPAIKKSRPKKEKPKPKNNWPPGLRTEE